VPLFEERFLLGLAVSLWHAELEAALLKQVEGGGLLEI
jgi:hypothetical protein